MQDLLKSVRKKIDNQDNRLLFSKIRKKIIDDKILKPSMELYEKYHSMDSLTKYFYWDCLSQKMPDNLSFIEYDKSFDSKDVNIGMLCPYNDKTLVCLKFALKCDVTYTPMPVVRPRKGSSFITEMPKEVNFIQPRDVGKKIITWRGEEFDTVNLHIYISPVILCVDQNYEKYYIQRIYKS